MRGTKEIWLFLGTLFTITVQIQCLLPPRFHLRPRHFPRTIRRFRFPGDVRSRKRSQEPFQYQKPLFHNSLPFLSPTSGQHKITYHEDKFKIKFLPGPPVHIPPPPPPRPSLPLYLDHIDSTENGYDLPEVAPVYTSDNSNEVYTQNSFKPHKSLPEDGHYQSSFRPSAFSHFSNKGNVHRRPFSHHASEYRHDDKHYDIPYNFAYGVSDDYHGTNFGHAEQRDKGITEGKYFVDLPDGRRMIVTYYADDYGYHPTITYEKSPLHYPSHSEYSPYSRYSESSSRHKESPYGPPLEYKFPRGTEKANHFQDDSLKHYSPTLHQQELAQEYTFRHQSLKKSAKPSYINGYGHKQLYSPVEDTEYLVPNSNHIIKGLPNSIKILGKINKSKPETPMKVYDTIFRSKLGL